MNDLETRLAEAFAARAERVQPEDLRDEPLPAQVVPIWRRVPVILAAAACLAVVATSTALLADRTPDNPQPSEPRPTLELPPDIGADWDRVKASTPAELDLDGDGTQEKVRFLAEPSEEYDGRLRLQTTLSRDGTDAHGILDLGSTIGQFALEPVDADRDGDEELVLFHEDPDGRAGPAFTGPTLAEPVVLDLRDGLLVRAPATEPDRLWRGNLVVPGAEADHYDLVHRQDFWVQDGVLLSSRSARSFPAFGMSVLVPEEYRVDVVQWSLAADGVLSPVPAEQPCLIKMLEGSRPCAQGEEDMLPPLAPVAVDRIGTGEGFQARDGYRFDVSLEAAASVEGGAALLVAGEDGRQIRTPLDPGAEVFTTSIMWDGASVVVASEAADQPGDLRVFVQDRDEMVALAEVGEVPLGSGETADGRTYRSWLTQNGALYTAIATSTDEGGSWRVHAWAVVDKGRITAIPIETVCFDDVSDPATGRRC